MMKAPNMNDSSKIDLSSLNIQVGSESQTDLAEVLSRTIEDGVLGIRLRFHSESGAPLSTSHIKWTIPAINVKGIWSSNLLYEKRIRADWEAPSLQSRISTDAPLVALFDHSDQNVMTAAVDDLVHRITISAPVREEDNLVYFSFKLFEENQDAVTHEVNLRIDVRPLLYSSVVQDFAKWWGDGLVSILPPVPAAFDPVYSTWYAYHQELNEDALLNECRQAVKLGYKVIILDDGWQTLDNNRGYDYTGDWQPDRFRDMSGFVSDVHDTGMKIMIWYSVPFCGVKSKAYEIFKNKLLTKEHRWAPVLDPRYPEVRSYLIGLYSKALREWNIDGFKLDFIDEFRMYPASEAGLGNGRDYASVEEAVERLLQDAITAMQSIKPDIIIEFRQRYISPVLRRFANMFRAFDCPNDAVTNRVRTTDVKLLCDSSAVHSDMITWSEDEKVEVAALQITNILFSVPQISIKLDELSSEYKAMISFYTTFWMEHRDVLMNGDFKAIGPLSNYPILRSTKNNIEIIGLYENHIVDLSGMTKTFIVNGKTSNAVVLDKTNAKHLSRYIVKDCQGQIVIDELLNVSSLIELIQVPQCGILELS